MVLTPAFRPFVVLLALATSACMTPTGSKPSGGHILSENVPPIVEASSIPPPVQQIPSLPKPTVTGPQETYSVVVKDVRVHDLLFALARDAKVNVDVHPGILGTVTLNAINQTLPQLLARIAKQVDMRWEMEGTTLMVMPDTPFLRTYKVDYVNMSRDMLGTVSVISNISTSSQMSGTGATGTQGTAAGQASNIAYTTVRNEGKNRFWESLEKNVKDILRETDKVLPEGNEEIVVEGEQRSTADLPLRDQENARSTSSSRRSPQYLAPAGSQESRSLFRRSTYREAASVIVNQETGTVLVRASSRQHEKVQEYIDSITSSAHRQVLIEATIAEIKLSNQYQQGIEWSRLRLTSLVGDLPEGWTLDQKATSTLGSSTNSANNFFTGTYRNPDSRTGKISSTIKLLESFGTVKVLSSPRISVLNNQTAILKVVDNIVYFQVQANVTSTQGVQTLAVSTTPQSVSVGLVMSVTPQVSDTESVLLNLRPTISRVINYVQDPNPQIPAGLVNRVPQIQTREMESVLRVNNGDVAVLGGLMEDGIAFNDDVVPGAYKVPGLGQLFTNRDDVKTKTELVVFLRPIIVKDASISGDYAGYRNKLPDENFFRNVPNPRALEIPYPSNPDAPAGGNP